MAGSSKCGDLLVKASTVAAFVPGFGVASLGLAVPMAVSAGMLASYGRERRENASWIISIGSFYGSRVRQSFGGNGGIPCDDNHLFQTAHLLSGDADEAGRGSPWTADVQCRLSGSRLSLGGRASTEPAEDRSIQKKTHAQKDLIRRA